MEKISLYDLLSLLLPGAIATVIIDYIFTGQIEHVKLTGLNQYVSLTVFLAASFFSGSIIHFISMSKWFTSVLKFFHIHFSIQEIYDNSTEISKYVKVFYTNLTKTFSNEDYPTKFLKMEEVWSTIYSKLEAEEKISSPKAAQSFFFFFRNSFTLAMLTLPVLIVMMIKNGMTTTELNYLFTIDVIVLIFSGLSAKFHRKRMVVRMFWTYYSLYKTENP